MLFPIRQRYIICLTNIIVTITFLWSNLVWACPGSHTLAGTSQAKALVPYAGAIIGGQDVISRLSREGVDTKDEFYARLREEIAKGKWQEFTGVPCLVFSDPLDESKLAYYVFNPKERYFSRITNHPEVNDSLWEYLKLVGIGYRISSEDIIFSVGRKGYFQKIFALTDNELELINTCLKGVNPHATLDSAITTKKNPPSNGGPSDIGAPGRKSNVCLFTGGTGGGLFGKVLEETIATTPILPLARLRLGTSVIVTTFDTGGGSGRLEDGLRDYLGYFPPPGDRINVLANMCTRVRHDILRFRTKGWKGLLTDNLKRLLAEAEGKYQPEELGKDWDIFREGLISIAEVMDERFISKGIISVADNTVGNFIEVGINVMYGAYNENKIIDYEKYREASRELYRILGISNASVFPCSFDEATLYAITKWPTICIDHEPRPITEEDVERGWMDVGGQKVYLQKREDGGLITKVNGDSITIREEFGDVISMASRTAVYKDSVGLGLLSTTGMGNVDDPYRLEGDVFQIGGVEVKIRGRLIVKQEHITEIIHFSPIEELGFVSGVKPRANPDAVETIKNTKDIICMGPGSLVTSLICILLIPEIVEAIRERRKSGLPTVFVFNPTKDNETVDATYESVIALIEKTAGCKFEDLFSHVIINDMVEVARQAIRLDNKGQILDVLELADEVSGKEKELLSRGTTVFSELGKSYRGIMGLSKEECEDLEVMIKKGDVPIDFEPSAINRVKGLLKDKGVEVITAPLLVFSETGREDRAKGGRKRGLPYEAERIAEILDDILMQKIRETKEYKELLTMFRNDQWLLDREIDVIMTLYPNVNRKIAVKMLYQYWVRQKGHSQIYITDEEVKRLPLPKVIISNQAYSLSWFGSDKEVKDIEPELTTEINRYLEAGGLFVVTTGLDKEQVQNKFANYIRGDLRRRIVIVSSSGAEIWGFNEDGTIMDEPYLSYIRITGQAQKGLGEIVDNAYKKFELDKPLYSLIGRKIDDAVVYQKRRGGFTFEMEGRRYIRAGMTERINGQLKIKGLPTMTRDYSGVYDLRDPVIEYLNSEFTKERLPVVASKAGLGAIDIRIKGVSKERAIEMAMPILGGMLKGELVPQEDILVIGRGNRDIAEKYNARYIKFQIDRQFSEQLPQEKLYKGLPGPSGAVGFFKALLSGRSIPGDGGHNPQQDGGDNSSDTVSLDKDLVLSHKIEEKWRIIECVDDRVAFGVRFFYEGELIVEGDIDIDSTAASIHTCRFKSTREGQGLATEFAARMYMMAYEISEFLGLGTRYAHVFFAMSNIDENAAEWWGDVQWKKFWKERYEQYGPFRRLGLEEKKLEGKPHLRGYYPERYYDHLADLKEVVTNSKAIWDGLFYESRIRLVCGDSVWDGVKDKFKWKEIECEREAEINAARNSIYSQLIQKRLQKESRRYFKPIDLSGYSVNSILEGASSVSELAGQHPERWKGEKDRYDELKLQWGNGIVTGIREGDKIIYDSGNLIVYWTSTQASRIQVRGKVGDEPEDILSLEFDYSTKCLKGIHLNVHPDKSALILEPYRGDLERIMIGDKISLIQLIDKILMLPNVDSELVDRVQLNKETIDLLQIIGGANSLTGSEELGIILSRVDKLLGLRHCYSWHVRRVAWQALERIVRLRPDLFSPQKVNSFKELFYREDIRNDYPYIYRTIYNESFLKSIFGRDVAYSDVDGIEVRYFDGGPNKKIYLITINLVSGEKKTVALSICWPSEDTFLFGEFTSENMLNMLNAWDRVYSEVPQIIPHRIFDQQITGIGNSVELIYPDRWRRSDKVYWHENPHIVVRDFIKGQTLKELLEEGISDEQRKSREAVIVRTLLNCWFGTRVEAKGIFLMDANQDNIVLKDDFSNGVMVDLDYLEDGVTLAQALIALRSYYSEEIIIRVLLEFIKNLSPEDRDEVLLQINKRYLDTETEKHLSPENILFLNRILIAIVNGLGIPINKKILKTNDIRGMAEKDFPAPVAIKLGLAYGAYLKKNLKETESITVSVGMDCRLSSGRIKDAFILGLTASGVDVVDIGMVPTPVLYGSIPILGVSGGVEITASHNPSDQNGFKLTIGELIIGKEQLLELMEIAEEGNFIIGDGAYEYQDVIPRYKDMIKDKFKDFSLKGMKIVVDAGNGVAGELAVDLLREFGAEVIGLYTEPDGTFPNHTPDPTVEENLLELRARVKELGANIGIGLDGDGDRIGLVDSNGDIVTGEVLLAILSRGVLMEYPGAKIIFDCKISQGAIDYIKSIGGIPIMWKTGHAHIKKKMREIGPSVKLGGELSGHIFYEDNYYFDDALYAAFKLLCLMQITDEDLAGLSSEVPKYISSPEIRAEIKGDSQKVVASIRKLFDESGYSIGMVDGIRVVFPEELGWALVRASGTEDVLTIRAEAKTGDGLIKILSELIVHLSNYPEMDISKIKAVLEKLIDNESRKGVKYERIIPLIDSLPWEELILAFDIDGVLTKRNMPMEEEIVEILFRFLENGIRIRFVTGKSREEVDKTNVLTPLVKLVKGRNRTELFNQIVVYTSEGAGKFHFSSEGELIIDTSYSRLFSDAEASEIEKAIQEVSGELDKRYKLGESGIKPYIRNFGNLKFNYSPYSKDAKEYRFESEGTRDRFTRTEIARWLIKNLRDSGITNIRAEISGASTIGFIRKDVSKENAIKDILKERRVVYFGDEVARGNDRKVGLMGGRIKDLTVISLDPYTAKFPEGVIWWGGKVTGARAVLQRIIGNLNGIKHGPRVIGIGGGDGPMRLVKGMADYTTNMENVITVFDNGASMGILRSYMDIPAVGDIRNRISALLHLVPGDKVLEGIFNYRFPAWENQEELIEELKNVVDLKEKEEGLEIPIEIKSRLKGVINYYIERFSNVPLSGMCVGNLILVAEYFRCEKSLAKAVRNIMRLLELDAYMNIIPVTELNLDIAARLINGAVIYGEYQIAHRGNPDVRIEELFFVESGRKEKVSPPDASPDVVDGIRQADAIVIGPGWLCIPNLMVKGVREAIRESKGAKILVINLLEFNEREGIWETKGYKASQIVDEVLRTLKEYGFMYKDYITHVLVNNHEEKKGYIPVDLDGLKEVLMGTGIEVVVKDLEDSDFPGYHDPRKLSKAIMEIIQKHKNMKGNPEDLFEGLERQVSTITDLGSEIDEDTKAKLIMVIKQLLLDPFILSEDLCKKYGLNREELIKIYKIIQMSKHIQGILFSSSDYSSQIEIMQDILLDMDFLERLFNGENPYPSEVEFHLSKKCNRRCSYCWSLGVDYKEGGQVLSRERIEQLIDEFSRNGVRIISFSGGKEPLTSPLTLKLIAFAKSRGLYVRLITNGILLGEEAQKVLLNAGVDFIRVSLDTINPETYYQIYNGKEEELNRIIENLKQFISLKRKEGKDNVKIGIGMLVDRQNYNQIEEMADFANKTGVDFIDIRALTDDKAAIFTSDELTSILQQGKRIMVRFKNAGIRIHFRKEAFFKGPLRRAKRCWSASRKMTVDLFGDVYNCCLTANPGYSEGHLVGNLFDYSKFSDFLGKTREYRSAIIPKYCKTCHFNESMVNMAVDKFYRDREYGIAVYQQPFVDIFEIIVRIVKDTSDICIEDILVGFDKDLLIRIVERLKGFVKLTDNLLHNVRTYKVIFDIYKMLGDEKMARIYEGLMFNTLKEAIRLSLYAEGIPGKVLKIPSNLEEAVIRVKAPIRIEFSSAAASDIFLISSEKGGVATNITANLEGEEPIQIQVRRLNEPVIKLESKDLGEKMTITTKEELLSFSDTSDPLRLLKAAFFVAGIISENDKRTLNEILSDFGGGVELITESNVPKSSGLGISGILGAAVLTGLFRISGQDITKQQVAKAVLYLEQLLGIGGGWQDPISGLYGGVKYIESEHGAINPQIEELELSAGVVDELEERVILYYFGRTLSVAEQLKRRVHIYLSRKKKEYMGFVKARGFPVKIKEALLEGDIDKLGRLLTEFTETIKDISNETMNDFVRGIINEVGDYICGYKLSSFSAARGFIIFVAKKGRSKELREKLMELSRVSGSRIYDWTINHSGLKQEIIFPAEQNRKEFVDAGIEIEIQDDKWAILLNSVLGKIKDKYGPGIFAVVDVIRTVPSSGPQVLNGIIPMVKEGNKNILVLDINMSADERLLYIMLARGLIKSIMDIVPCENNAVRELTANYISLKLALEEGVKFTKAQLEKLGADLQFFEALDALQSKEDIIPVVIEYMRNMPYYAGLFKQFEFAEEWQDRIKDAEDRYRAALRVFNEIMEEKKGLDRTVEEIKINIKVVKTFTGKMRIIGLEGLPRRLQEMIGAMAKQIYSKDRIAGQITRASDIKYILVDSARLKELKDVISDKEYERIAKNLCGNNYQVCTEIPQGVGLGNVIRLVDPVDLENMPQMEGILYLPMPYTRSSFYMAANVLSAKGEPSRIDSLVKELIKGLYRELDDNDLVVLFKKPWEILPKIQDVLVDLDNLRKAVMQIEKAA